jgi:hypothetical protein
MPTSPRLTQQRDSNGLVHSRIPVRNCKKAQSYIRKIPPTSQDAPLKGFVASLLRDGRSGSNDHFIDSRSSELSRGIANRATPLAFPDELTGWHARPNRVDTTVHSDSLMENRKG